MSSVRFIEEDENGLIGIYVQGDPGRGHIRKLKKCNGSMYEPYVYEFDTTYNRFLNSYHLRAIANKLDELNDEAILN